MRAALYARYSSDNQREASIEDQLRLCRAVLAREGWTETRAYTDRAISGASSFRPEYQALLQDARARRFDMLVAEGLDRLSRDQGDLAHLYRELRFLDIGIVTVAEGTINELHVGLKGTMNQLFLKDLALKTHRGLEGRVREGRSAGGRCYGYDVVRQFDARGERIAGERSINPAEAAVVTRIFTEYAAGKSPRSIVHDLNLDGIDGPNGGNWGFSTLVGNRARGTGLLNNELYIGKLVWNRLRYVKDPATGKRISRLNPKEKWIVHDVPDLRILDQPLWDGVQARLDQLRDRGDAVGAVPKDEPRPFWAQRRPRYLFSGLMKCGACGGSAVKVNASDFGCAAARDKGPAVCTNLLRIRRDVLESIVLDALRDGIMDADLYGAFVAEFTAEWNRLQAGHAGDRTAREQELTRVKAKLKRMVAAIAEGAPVRTIKAEMESLEAREAVLEEELASAPPAAPRLHPNLAAIYRKKIDDLQGALAAEKTPEIAEAIRALVGEIRLVPVEGRLAVEVTGNLAGILSLASDKRVHPAGPFGPDREIAELTAKIKLVAGTGFEPVTFRL